MPLGPDLVSLANRLIEPAIAGRNEELRAYLARRRDDAVASGRVHNSYYAREQEAACVKDMNERVDQVWDAYRRVLTEAAVAWTEDLRQEVLSHIDQLLERDIPYVEEMARPVISHEGHNFYTFLRDAKKSILERIAAEIDLFSVRHRPVGVAVVLQLQAPRYASPRQHWKEAQEALRSSPPKIGRAHV